jgi:opine dehydrogenase
VAASCADALADAEAVLVALPGNAHRMVFDAMASHLTLAQIVLISGHLSFGALYLARTSRRAMSPYRSSPGERR